MFRAQRLLLDPERPLEQGYRLVVLALVKPEPAVVGDGLGHGRMVRAQGLFPDRQRPGVEILGFRIPANLAVNVGQVVKRLPDAFVFRPLAPLANGQGLLEDLFRLLETAQFPI